MNIRESQVNELKITNKKLGEVMTINLTYMKFNFSIF
jgi:hypothetical protein